MVLDWDSHNDLAGSVAQVVYGALVSNLGYKQATQVANVVSARLVASGMVARPQPKQDRPQPTGWPKSDGSAVTGIDYSRDGTDVTAGLRVGLGDDARQNLAGRIDATLAQAQRAEQKQVARDELLCSMADFLCSVHASSYPNSCSRLNDSMRKLRELL